MHLLSAPVHRHVQHGLRTLSVGAVDLSVEQEVELALVDLGEPLCNLLVLFSEEGGAPVNDGDLGAQGTVEVGHLGGDVATADYGQPTGLLRQPEGLVGGDVRHLREAGDLRRPGTGSGGDQDGLRGDLVALHL